MHKEKEKWYEHEKNKVRYRQLKEPFDNVCVGSTPIYGMTRDFAQSFDIFLNVSDRPYYSNSTDKPREDTIYFWKPIQEYQFWGYEPFFDTKIILDNAYEEDKNVYLHCKSGVNRSPCIVMGWLISRGYDLEEAAEILSYNDPKRIKTFIKVYEHNVKHKRIPMFLDMLYEVMRNNKGKLENTIANLYNERFFGLHFRKNENR